MTENYFNTLNSINVSDKIEKKNGLSYLSWAWAWGELKKRHPSATYTVYETADGMNYFTDGKTAWVKTGVTVDGIEHIEYLPVMDYKNKSIILENITSFDVNKTIQRSLTKAVARHGLGLYIYAGEDLPDGDSEKDAPASQPLVFCECCGNVIEKVKKKDGATWQVSEMVEYSKARFEKALCSECMKVASKK